MQNDLGNIIFFVFVMGLVCRGLLAIILVPDKTIAQRSTERTAMNAHLTSQAGTRHKGIAEQVTVQTTLLGCHTTPAYFP
jgi:hypothetical protein